MQITKSEIHRFDSLDQQETVGFNILHKYEEKFEGRFHDKSVPASNQRVKPLDGSIVLHHAIHSVDVEHDLPESYCAIRIKQ